MLSSYIYSSALRWQRPRHQAGTLSNTSLNHKTDREQCTDASTGYAADACIRSVFSGTSSFEAADVTDSRLYLDVAKE